MQNSTALEYNFLRFIPFKSLSIWDAKRIDLINSLYQDNQQLFKLSELLKPVKRNVSLQDNDEYNLLGISSYGNGAFHRGSKKGKNISAKTLYKIETGDIVYSRLGASTGSFALIDECFNNYYVSNEFPSFKIKDNNKVNPDFLIYILTSERFYKLISVQNTGSALKRFHESKFLNLEIPLPSLDVQKHLVKAYLKNLNQAGKLEQEHSDLGEQIEEYLLEKLGIEFNTQDKKISAKLYFIDFKNLNRWDGKKYDLYNSKYETDKIGNYINHIATGTTPPTTKKEYFNGDINFFTPADLGNEMYLKNSSRAVSQKAVDANKVRIFKQGTLLFVGIGSTVGKIGIVGTKIATSNQQITGFMVDENKLSSEYVYCFYNQFKQITTAEKTVSTIPIINQDKITNIKIPLPPLEIQKEITENIQQMKDSQKDKFQQAQQLKKQALLDFENAIFKPAE